MVGVCLNLNKDIVKEINDRLIRHATGRIESGWPRVNYS